MKKKLSVLYALIKARNIPTCELEEKTGLPKGYISKVIDGKQTMKIDMFIKLLEELDITLDQYEKLNKKAKLLYTNSTLTNEKRWQNLLLEIYLTCNTNDIEKQNNPQKKK